MELMNYISVFIHDLPIYMYIFCQGAFPHSDPAQPRIFLQDQSTAISSADIP